MEDIKKISINITGIEQKDNRVSLLEQTGDQKYPIKYTFFTTKQDGTESKAFKQFKELGVSIGKVYTIAVKETQGVNKVSGKSVIYRNILGFETGVSNTQQTPKTSPSSNSGLTEVNKRLDLASQAFKEMQNKMKELETRIGVLELESMEKQEKELSKIPY